MLIDPVTGSLGGTPTVAPGIFNPQFTVKDSGNTTFSANIPLTITSVSSPLVITGPISLAAGTTGVAYGPVTFLAVGGTGYTWSATGLPPGMGIDPSTGALGGTPTVTGAFSPQFLVTDTANDTFSLSLSLAINPPGCNYMLSSGGQVFAAAGGSGSVDITAAPGCAWIVSAAPLWMTFSSDMSGTGNATIQYHVAANTGADLTATLMIAGLPFTVELQPSSIAGLNPIGSLAHLLAEENWTTTLTLVNKSAVRAGAAELFRRRGRRWRERTAPTAAGIPAAASGSRTAAGRPRSIRRFTANASLLVTTAGPQTPPVLVGSVQLARHGPGGRIRDFPPES